MIRHPFRRRPDPVEAYQAARRLDDRARHAEGFVPRTMQVKPSLATGWWKLAWILAPSILLGIVVMYALIRVVVWLFS